MLLTDKYSINVRYQRATRIDNDLSADFFPGLVFHGTAENTLRTLGKQYSEARQRAFTVTGPYGTGKSTIALLLAGCLHDDKVIRKAAEARLGKTFRKEFGSYFQVKKGWLIVRSVGGIGHPVGTMWESVVQALAENPGTSSLDYADAPTAPSSDDFYSFMQEVLQDVKGKVDGVLFMLDEMGKTVEHFIRDDNKSLKVQFFQNFAELFSDVPGLFVGFLHQAFSEYAQSRGKAIQDEWAKIQGRYTDLLYNVSEDETVALIAQSIEAKFELDGAEQSKNALVEQVCGALQRKKLRKSKELQSRLLHSFPLHPSVALLLGPISKRRFSQNERSTFSFLNSREPHSFHSFLEEHEDKGNASYRLYDLWDYLESNLEHHIIGTNDGHAWTVASEAIVRTSNHDSDIHRQVVKTIAVLNLFGRTLGMFATEAALKGALDHIDQKQLKGCLQDLRDQSTITFRKHLSAWAVFEGSDFDLEGLLEEQRDSLQFDDSWMSVLDYQRFTIAKRHYHETGTLRWIDQRVALSADAAEKQGWKSKNEAFASFLLLVNESQEKAKRLVKFSQENKNFVVGVCQDVEPLKVAARELYALQVIAQDTPELMHDKIAAKEYEARKANAQKELDRAYDNAFSNSLWWSAGKEIRSESLNVIASRVADVMYGATPRIFNELINRKKPSGTSNAARRKLMERMVEFADQDNLGLDEENCPPEKAIYLSCLKQTGLHTALNDGGHGFVIPDQPESDSLRTMLKATEKMINSSSELVTLADIYSMWEAKPYGLTAGLAPVLALAYLLSRDEELAYYDKDSTAQYVFIPEIDEEFVNKMMRAPKDVAVRYFEVSGVKHHYIHTFAKVAGNKLEREIPPQALSVARPIVTFVHQLPPWVKNARLTDGPAKKFRDAVMKANDPYRLLLEDLYSVFGMDTAKSEKDSDKLLDNALNSAIDELRSMHIEMLNGYKKILTAELGGLDESLRERCNRVKEVAADFRLQAFAQRLGQSSSSNDRWLESLIALVASAPAKDWNDTILARGREELFEYCQRFKRVETFAAAGNHSTNEKSKSIALIIGSGGQAEEYVRQVTINDKQANEVNALKAKLINILKKHDADDLKALALQETLQEVLSPYEAPVCAMEGAK